jgi:hypothetical protein
MVLLPVARAVPLTVKVATPLLPDISRVPLPSVLFPKVNVTVPPGAAAVALAGFTVAVIVVLALLAILAGLAETVVVVDMAGTVAVTVTVPLDAEKALPAPYVAVIVLLPVASELPFTVKVATPLLPDTASVPVPSVLVPSVKVTAPPGAAVPLAGFTVAVSIVLAVLAILEGLAATVVVVATAGTITVTVAVPLDAVKEPLAA